ncbi:MAG: VOC family protein [Maritimibacter sp.]
MHNTTLDHIVISAPDLLSGARHVETALGVPMGAGGAHEVMGTHNQLLSLGATDYLEVIAVDARAPNPKRPRWYGLDDFAGAPRLTNWALRVEDLDKALELAPAGAGAPLQVTRGSNRWRLSVPEEGQMPWDGLFPALIEWETPCPAPNLPDQGARLHSFTLSHPEAGTLSTALAPFLADDRVSLRQGPIGITAEISTESGLKTLR